MAIRKSFGGKSIYKPGPYSKYSVDNSAGTSGSTDVCFLIGEAAKGAPGATEGIQAFDAANLSALVTKYGSGPLVDCAVAAIRPSKTSGVGGAGRILVWKTNASTQASASLLQSASAYATIKGAAWGSGDNGYSAVVAAGDSARQRNISITQLGGTTEVLTENPALPIITVHYTGNGSAATLAIAGATRAALTLTTTLTGPSDGSANLSKALANMTVKQLVDYINAQTGYVATVATASKSANSATDLDPITATDIKGQTPNFYRIQKEIIEMLNTSARITATEPTQPLGSVPDVQTKALTGGVQGASTNTNFSNGLSASMAEEYNQVLACVSRDASEDIADAQTNFTDAGSTYTIAAVLAAVSSHLAQREDVAVGKEAQGFGGVRKSTKAAAYTAVNTVADYKMQVAMQDCVFSNAAGNLVVGHPHVFAAMCMGMRLGSDTGEPLTHKVLNVNQVGHFLDAVTLVGSGDFNPATDYNDAIINGVLFSEKVGGANRIVVDNTTYGIDDSFVFNRGSVINASYFVFKTLRATADSIFVGKKVSNGLAKSIKSAVRNKLRELNAPDVQIITSSIDAPEGFREATFTVTITGNSATVTVEFKPVQGLDFVFFNFTLGDIKQSA